MTEEQLTALTDSIKSVNGSLERIASSLERLDKNLGGCMAVSGDNRFFCVTGNVTTYSGCDD